MDPFDPRVRWPCSRPPRLFSQAPPPLSFASPAPAPIGFASTTPPPLGFAGSAPAPLAFAGQGTYPPPMCPDWTFNSFCNTHVCKDRGWFSRYQPFESKVFSRERDSYLDVVGVGTINIPIVKSHDYAGPDAYHMLVLEDVLHCPRASFNIIGIPDTFLRNYTAILHPCNGLSMGKLVTEKGGQKVGYFAPNKPIPVIKLLDPPVGPIVGPSVLHIDGRYTIDVQWDVMEKERWQMNCIVGFT